MRPLLLLLFESDLVFENKDKIVLVMQFASGGELYEYVSDRKMLTDAEARRLFRQIATAVYYCHKVCNVGYLCLIVSFQLSYLI